SSVHRRAPQFPFFGGMSSFLGMSPFFGMSSFFGGAMSFLGMSSFFGTMSSFFGGAASSFFDIPSFNPSTPDVNVGLTLISGALRTGAAYFGEASRRQTNSPLSAAK